MSIAQVCKIEGCEKTGQPDNTRGKRYLLKGMCSMHYQRVTRYKISPNANTRFTKRPAIIEGNIAKIPIGVNAKDGYAIVDKEFAWLDKYKWSLSGVGYATANTGMKSMNMHKVILPELDYIDHANRDKLDNRKSNLRKANHSLNMANTKSTNKTGYRGVSEITWNKTKSWRASINKDNIRHNLGAFTTPIDAARAYNKKAVELFGEFAVINEGI